MTQLDDFLNKLIPYTTSSGLIEVNILPIPKPLDCGDNSVMFFCESNCIASKINDKDLSLKLNFLKVMAPYFMVPGLLQRREKDTDVDGPDNMLGVLAASKLLKEKTYARSIFWYGVKHFGFFNRSDPGSIFIFGTHKICWEAFLWRQLQLVAATISASQFSRIIKLLFFPLYLYTALVIVYSGLFRKPVSEDMDSRRLAWLLVQCVKDDSILCWLASKIWYRGLRKDYPLDKWKQSMRGVASYYYGINHPFTEYWKD